MVKVKCDYEKCRWIKDGFCLKETIEIEYYDGCMNAQIKIKDI